MCMATCNKIVFRVSRKSYSKCKSCVLLRTLHEYDNIEQYISSIKLEKYLLMWTKCAVIKLFYMTFSDCEIMHSSRTETILQNVTLLLFSTITAWNFVIDRESYWPLLEMILIQRILSKVDTLGTRLIQNRQVFGLHILNIQWYRSLRLKWMFRSDTIRFRGFYCE